MKEIRRLSDHWHSIRGCRWNLGNLLPLFAAMLLLAPFPIFGQVTVGNIAGTVTAPDGSTVPHATVTITNVATGVQEQRVTDDQGLYQVSDLNPGTYTVTVAAQGFRTFQNIGVTVTTGQTVRINAAMKVGSTTSTVVVTAGAPVIQTDMPSISNTVTAGNLQDSSSNLLSTADATGDSGILFYTTLLPGGYKNAGYAWSLYGSRSGEAYYNVDGISGNSVIYGNMVGPAEPPFDMMQEVDYNEVDNKAEMGQILNITMVTKSGTNQYHGDFYDHNMNTAFVARNYFANSVGLNIENDFGGHLGGPIIHDKWFFSASGEFLRQAEPVSIDPSLPTLAMRTGDFSALLTGPNPTVIVNPYNGTPFPNNMIPSGMLNSAALTWQQRFYPAPNYGPADNFIANFRGTYPQHIYTNRYDIRSDYVFSPSNTAFVRVGYVRSSPEVLDSGLPVSLTGYRVQRRQTWQGVISDTWTLSPNLINVAKFGITHTFNNFGGSLTGQPLIDSLGITGFPVAPSTATGIPSLSINDFTSPAQLQHSEPTEETLQYIDQMTYQKGHHTIRAGMEYRPQEADQYFNPSFGTFGFNGSFTNFAYADFLLGLPQGTGYTFTRTPEYARLWFLSAFAQDDWKIRPNLTLSLGVRYDYDQPAVDKYHVVSSFNPANGDIVVPSSSVAQNYINPLFPSQIPIETAQQAGFPADSLRYAFKTALYPRLGFAYSPLQRTVIRGAYGIYNDDLTADIFNNLYGGPFGISVGYTNSITAGTPAVTFQHPINSSAGGLGVGSVSTAALATHLRNPYVQQFNLTVEQDLGYSTGLRISYIGTRGVDLIYGRNINQVPVSTTPFSQSNTPYPLFYTVSLFDNGGYTNYNALSAEVQRPLRKGLNFEAGLTWTKNLTDDDDLGDPEGGYYAEDSYNIHRQKGNAEYDPRIGFVSNLNWNLPIGRGQLLLNGDELASRVLGGWTLSGAYLGQTGQYLTPTFSGFDPSNTNQFAGTADRIGNPSLSGRSITKWFNTAAYAVPGNGSFGDAAFGSIEGPDFNVVNLALIKSFPIYREAQFQIEGSFSNVLNHTNFGNPDTTITDAAAGQITSTTGTTFGGSRSGLISGVITF
jgi:hypothetical protein